MRLFALARLSTCVLLCLCPALLGHCGGAAKDELHGTETGNPPVVDSQKLRLVAGASGVELIAEPGAVSGGAEVRLDNRSTGATAAVTANSDGSFRVVVTGTALDTFEVTVTYQGGSVTLSVSVATASSDVRGDAGADPIDPSCEALRNGLDAELSSAIEPFATGCSNDSDCSVLDWDVGCYSGCGYSYLVAGQSAAAAAAAAQSLAPTCSELEQRGCTQPESRTCPAGYASPLCFGGTCQSWDQLSCTDLGSLANQRANDVLATVDGSCNVDEDCVLGAFSSLSCVASCGFTVAVPASALEGLRQSIKGVEDSICGTFSARDCTPPPAPGCPLIPALRAVCTDNRCNVISGS